MTASTVLIVDDDQDIRELVLEMLERENVPCRGAATGEEAIELVTTSPERYDVIVLDVNMPGIDGTDVLRFLQAAPATAHIPVIMMTAGATGEADVVHGVEWGASDYLAKPCPANILLAKVKATRRRALAGRQVRDALAFASHSATTDALTGLFNRRHFDARLTEASSFSRRHQQPFALVMIDVDHFKRVNDTLGHAEGDRVLMELADHIRAVLRADDVAFRYGGEEFALLLHACDASRAEEVAERLRQRLHANPHRSNNGSERTITFSAGAAAATASEAFACHDLVRRADEAMYFAKANGRDNIQRWQESVEVVDADILEASAG